MIRRALASGVSAGLAASRVPLQVVGPLLPGRVRGVVELGADHAQALAETKIGALLGDERLAERGQQRRVAVEQRVNAVRLWGEAGEKRRLADLELAQERSEAAQRRRRVEEQEQAQRRAVEEAKDAGHQQAEKAADKRKAAVRAATTRRKESADQAAMEQRLEVLDSEEAALDVGEDALTAADEAARLKKAAAEAKRRRTG
jgi:hypothetical protein